MVKELKELLNHAHEGCSVYKLVVSWMHATCISDDMVVKSMGVDDIVIR